MLLSAKLYSNTVYRSKIAYSCCLIQGGNLNYLDFLKKSFITSTTGIGRSH